MPNDGGQAAADVAKVGLKLPPFWDKHPVLWFANIEAQFIVSGITQDATKYYSVISGLTSEILNYVSDIVLTPPETEKYETLILRHALSTSSPILSNGVSKLLFRSWCLEMTSPPICYARCVS